ncbi:MAG TPA: hypothetical protein VLD37_05155 [Candidatus Bilamarchaeum sp.]|nr:hypothetical protein [Candidatus Bilamarchaeum sp.]
MRGAWLVLALGLMLSGCLSVETTHKQNADGSAEITQVTDLSILLASGSAYGGSDTLENICGAYVGVVCMEEDGIVTIKKTFKPSDAFYTFETKDDIFFKRYRLTIDRMPDFTENLDKSSEIFGGSSSGSYDDYYGDYYDTPYGSSSEGSYGNTFGNYLDNEETKFTDTSAKASAAILRQAKVESAYTVVMPGSITSAEDALETNGSSATFDVVTMMEKRKAIVVTSEEANAPLLIFAGVAGFALLLVAAFIAIGMLKPRQV